MKGFSFWKSTIGALVVAGFAVAGGLDGTGGLRGAPSPGTISTAAITSANIGTIDGGATTLTSLSVATENVNFLDGGFAQIGVVDAGILHVAGVATINGNIFTTGGFVGTDSVQDFNSVGPLTLKGTMSDGASAVGVASRTSATWSNAGAKIHSFRNNTTEKAYVDIFGGFTSLVASGSNAITLTTGARCKVGGGTNDYFVSDGSGIKTPGYFQVGGTLYVGTGSAGSAVIAQDAGGTSPLALQGGATSTTIAKFQNGTGVEKSKIDTSGNYENEIAGEGIIVKAPGGARYKITVSDIGVVTATGL